MSAKCKEEFYHDFARVIKDRYSSAARSTMASLSQQSSWSILEAGRLAPTAKNLQEQHIYVVPVRWLN